jgi:hypothetical protein
MSQSLLFKISTPSLLMAFNAQASDSWALLSNGCGKGNLQTVGRAVGAMPRARPALKTFLVASSFYHILTPDVVNVSRILRATNAQEKNAVVVLRHSFWYLMKGLTL